MNKNSKTEEKFRKEAKEKGYEIFSKGYPDYVIVKDKEVLFIECKRPGCEFTKKKGYSLHQVKMRDLFRKLGLKWITYMEQPYFWKFIDQIK